MNWKYIIYESKLELNFKQFMLMWCGLLGVGMIAGFVIASI